MSDNIVRVGVGIIILNDDGQILMGRRKNAHGEGAWSCPGGHLEFGEDIIACAVREAKEETDLDVTDVEIIGLGNHLFPTENKHYITIYCIGRAKGAQTPIVCEPHKCDGWSFFNGWDDLPHPLFIPYQTDIKADVIAAYKSRFLLPIS